MYDFTYTALASRVVFGLDSVKHVEREVELLGASRAAKPGKLWTSPTYRSLMPA